jgi:PAS domain S-box-containing protein
VTIEHSVDGTPGSVRVNGERARIHTMQALLEAAEELAQVGSWEWTPSESTLVWSDNLFCIFGLEPGAIVPTTAYVADHTHPDDRDHVATQIQALRESGELRPLQYRTLMPDGGVRHLQATLAVAEWRDDVPHRLVGWVQDISERLWAEREIAAHFAVARAIAAWDSLEIGGERLLADLTGAMGFTAAVLWVPSGDVLEARVCWHADVAALTTFETVTRTLRPPRGITTAGEAWERLEPVGLDGVVDGDAARRRQETAGEGLRGAVAVPAISGGEVLAVVELLSREDTELTARLRRSLMGIGFELGQFLARRRGELDGQPLTARELEVLQLAAQGRSARQIGESLGISPSTVRTHLENIYPKLDVGAKSAAVAKALRRGLID